MNTNCRVAAFYLLTCAAVAAGAARVETLDAQATTGELVSIDPEKHRLVLRTGKEEVSVPLADVSEITWGDVPDAMDKTSQLVLTTPDGGRLVGTSLALADSSFRVQTAMMGEVKASINSISALYFANPQMTVAQLQAKVRELTTDSSQDSLFVVKKDGSWVTVDGSLKAITEKDVTFRWKDADRVTDRAAVVAVRLVSLKHDRPSVTGEVLGIDGSVIPFSQIAAEEKKILVQSSDLGSLDIPLKSVAAIRFASTRIVPLAELKPSRIEQHGFFDEKISYRLNRSAGGKRMTLGGTTYDSGLGLHSFCELTYNIEGQYAKFVSTVGIDDAVRPAGDAALAILGDGKPLAELRVTGKDKPQAVKLDVRKIKTLVIRVDFGPDKLAAGDQVDLAGARLIK